MEKSHFLVILFIAIGSKHEWNFGNNKLFDYENYYHSLMLNKFCSSIEIPEIQN